MSAFASQFCAHEIPSSIASIKGGQLDIFEEKMSEFAAAFFAHMLGSDMKYHTRSSQRQNKQCILHSVTKISLDPRDTFVNDILFTSPGDSEYYACSSLREDRCGMGVYEDHLFVVPKLGDVQNAKNYAIWFDSAVGVYRVVESEPMKYGFGKQSVRGCFNRVWGERSAVDIDVESHQGRAGYKEPTETLDAKWNALATQAWGSSELGNWADESAEVVEEQPTEISALASTSSAGVPYTETYQIGDFAPSKVADAREHYGDSSTGGVAVTAELDLRVLDAPEPVLSDRDPLDDSLEVAETREAGLAEPVQQRIERQESAGWNVAHGVSTVRETCQTMSPIEEGEEEEESDDHMVETTNRASDGAPEDYDVPLSILRSQVPDFSDDDIYALRGKWNKPGMALLDLTWQSMARTHQDMVQRGLYTQKRLEASESVHCLSLMGIEDQSVMMLAKGLKLISYEKPVVEAPKIVHHYNLYGEAIHYPTYTSKLHSIWASCVRKNVNSHRDLHKWTLVHEAEKAVDKVYDIGPPKPFCRGSKGFTRDPRAGAFAKRSYWPRKSLMAQMEFHQEELSDQIKTQDNEEVAKNDEFDIVNKVFARASTKLEIVEPRDNTPYLEAQGDDTIDAENIDFYGTDEATSQPNNEPVEDDPGYRSHSPVDDTLPHDIPGLSFVETKTVLKRPKPSLLASSRNHSPSWICTSNQVIGQPQNVSGSSGTTAVGTPTSPPEKALEDLEEMIMLKLTTLACAIEYTKARTRELSSKLGKPEFPSGLVDAHSKTKEEIEASDQDWVGALALLDNVGDDLDLKVKSMGAQLKGSIPEEEPPTDSPSFVPRLLVLAAAFLICSFLF
ncbi:MAG: hypothetical protein M1812_001901 [Candelaria pacifica]|nr:MAG: hypothetical protein M1812_001901 [Candelaria pacifica]